ncbi:spore germination protein YndF [Pullulanibacillus camelliae]|uniref:Spore germination protein YndF n=1 Tax=Pullulanibacillus camelliae TaxID=1707096 RepID=A0A8J2VLJ1_9BACL|nr:Ger(x)C family spore germination protein [Pullulanibacillus camelliae]GGE36399.1 spore germination protein YndF [Pullulanibacillus camelliae]
MKIRKIRRYQKKLKLALLSLCALFTLTGCWDRVDIEDRGFVIAMAIDMDENGRYVLTEQIAIPGSQSTSGNGNTGGGSQNEAFFNVVGKGHSIMDIIRESTAKTSRTPYYEHVKVIIVSKKVAQSPAFDDSIDYFIRSPEMRRGTKVMITNKIAGKILNNTPPGATIPGLYIDQITQNPYRNERVIPATRIGDVNESLYRENSFMIQYISADQNILNIEGAAVFHGNTTELASLLTPRQTAGINYLKGEARGGTISSKYQGHEVSLLVKNSERKIQLLDAKDPTHMSFKITMNIDGLLLETGTSLNFINGHSRDNIQRRLERTVDANNRRTLHVLQQDLNADVIGLSDYLRIHNWDLWQKIQNHWDSGGTYFKNADIQLETHLFIRNTGTINRTKKQN